MKTLSVKYIFKVLILFKSIFESNASLIYAIRNYSIIFLINWFLNFIRLIFFFLKKKHFYVKNTFQKHGEMDSKIRRVCSFHLIRKKNGAWFFVPGMKCCNPFHSRNMKFDALILEWNQYFPNSRRISHH